MEVRIARGLTAVALAACATTGTLRPFSSDGCSAFLDGTPWERELWKHCCYEHDVRYWRGGSSRERRDADDELHRCVNEVENRTVAALMLAGVRVGGSPYWPAPYRWAYGWPYGRGYRALTDEERGRADRLLKQAQAQHPPPTPPRLPGETEPLQGGGDAPE